MDMKQLFYIDDFHNAEDDSETRKDVVKTLVERVKYTQALEERIELQLQIKDALENALK